MPPRDPNLASLWSEVDRYSSPVQTAIAAPAIPYRNAPRNRPPPRQMRPAEQRAMDPNAGVRRQAMGQLERRAGADLATMPRTPRGNQFAEAGSMALEATGLPQVRRGAETLGDVAQAPYQPNAPMRALSGAGELGLGVLGAATFGEVGAMRPRPTAPPRSPARFDDTLARSPFPTPPDPSPPLTRPPTDIAPNGMPIRPPQPFRNSLRGGNDDLAEAAGMRPTQTPDAGQSGAGNDDWVTIGYRGLTQPFDGEVRPAQSGLHGPGVYINDSPDIAGVHGEYVYPVQVRRNAAFGSDFVSASRERGDVGFRMGRDRVIFDPANMRMGERYAPNAPDVGNGLAVSRERIELPRAGGAYGDGNFTVLKNPTAEQLSAFAREDALADRGMRRRFEADERSGVDPLQYQELRYVSDVDGNIYVLSGNSVEHKHATDGLRARGINVGSGMRGDNAGLIQYRDGQWAYNRGTRIVKPGPFAESETVLEPIDYGYPRTQRQAVSPEQMAEELGVSVETARGLLARRAPNAPARGNTTPKPSDGQAMQAPTLGPTGPDRNLGRGIFGPQQRPGIRDMQPEGIYASQSRRIPIGKHGVMQIEQAPRGADDVNSVRSVEWGWKDKDGMGRMDAEFAPQSRREIANTFDEAATALRREITRSFPARYRFDPASNGHARRYSRDLQRLIKGTGYRLVDGGDVAKYGFEIEPTAEAYARYLLPRTSLAGAGLGGGYAAIRNK